MSAMTNIPDDKLDNVTGGMEEDILITDNVCPTCKKIDEVVLSKDAHLGFVPAEKYYCKRCGCSFGPKVN